MQLQAFTPLDEVCATARSSSLVRSLARWADCNWGSLARLPAVRLACRPDCSALRSACSSAATTSMVTRSWTCASACSAPPLPARVPFRYRSLPLTGRTVFFRLGLLRLVTSVLGSIARTDADDCDGDRCGEDGFAGIDDDLVAFLAAFAAVVTQLFNSASMTASSALFTAASESVAASFSALRRALSACFASAAFFSASISSAGRSRRIRSNLRQGADDRATDRWASCGIA